MPPAAAQAAAPAAPAAQPDLSNDFDAVFDSIINGTINNEATETPTNDGAAGAADDAAQPDQSGDGEAGAAKPAAAGGDAADADGEGQSVAGGEDAGGGDAGGKGPVATPAAPDYAAQIAALTAEIAALKAAPAAAAAPKTPEPPAEQPVYTQAELAEIDTLSKDWPDIKRLIELMTRQNEVNVIKYTFGELGKILGPLQQSVGVLTGNEHVDAIYSAHPDYDQVYNPCMEWIEKQPAFLKKTYQNVVKDGTSEEVAEMIQKFKDETKWVAPAAAAAPAPAAAPAGKPAKPQKAELSVAAKQAAQAIGAVGTKRGGAAAAQDPADFDGAWAEATASK